MSNYVATLVGDIVDTVGRDVNYNVNIAVLVCFILI